VRPCTIYRLVAGGQLPATRVSHAIRIARTDLTAFLAAQTVNRV
jgi:excisionase family DNA binding protein